MATCEWCGREFEDYPPHKPFCSRKCEAEDPNAPELIRKYEWRKSPEGMQFAQEREEKKKAREREWEEKRKKHWREEEKKAREREAEKEEKLKANTKRDCLGCCGGPLLIAGVAGGIGALMDENGASEALTVTVGITAWLLIFASIKWAWKEGTKD